MNIEAYDVDSLRKMVRILEYENRLLKDKLKKASIPYDEVNPFEEKIENAEEYDPDQGERIVNPPFITEEMAIRFFSMFWGREDVYARRGKNGGYFPQCANRWNDRLCHSSCHTLYFVCALPLDAQENAKVGRMAQHGESGAWLYRIGIIAQILVGG